MKILKGLILSLCLIVFSCCPDVLCECPQPEIRFMKSRAGSRKVIRVNKNYSKIDSSELIFSSGLALLTRDDFNFSPDEDIDDYNYLIQNTITKSTDTISNISYDVEPYSFECVDCILKKDIKRCDNIVNQRLLLNGEVVEGFSVTID